MMPRVDFLGASFAVGILDPQQELAAVVAAVEVVEQRGPDAADMQRAGRAGGEAGADGHGGACSTPVHSL